MHADHKENIFYDSYIVGFEYYERGKYGYRNFHATQLPLLMFKLLMLHSSYLHMLDIACLDNLFSYKMHMHSVDVVKKGCSYSLTMHRQVTASTP